MRVDVFSAELLEAPGHERGEVALLLPRHVAIMAHTNTNSRVLDIQACENSELLSQELENSAINAQTRQHVSQPGKQPCRTRDARERPVIWLKE